MRRQKLRSSSSARRFAADGGSFLPKAHFQLFSRLPLFQSLGTHNMDRISYLPQSILHDILSRLPDKDAARTSVLSKAWHDTWSTFPFLVFDESRYERTQIPNGADIRLQTKALDQFKFCELVLGTLVRFQSKGLAIRKFKVVFKSILPRDQLFLVSYWMKFLSVTLVNDWMKILCDSGVEVLQLDNGVDKLQNKSIIPPDSYDEFPCLPLCVLEAKSLIKLELFWYFRVDQTFLNHPIKFSSLQVLSLANVCLGDEQVIQKIISSCPLIEKLELVLCFELKSVSIHGLPKLKVVFIVGIEEVDVDASSLEDIIYDASGFQTVIPRKINVDKCKNLRKLCLAFVTSIVITDQWLLEIFQKFPLLEKLGLEGFSMSEIINISSIQLKVLDLCHCYDLEKILIDAPNLYECNYHGDGSVLPSISIMNSSSQLVLDVGFFIDVLLDMKNLRNFLEGIRPKHTPVFLVLCFGDDSTVEFDPSELEDYSMAPPSIKHVDVVAYSDTEEWSLLLVTSLFWSCHPSIVSFDLDANKTLVKIFCEKLIGRKENDCSCSSSQIKCWWHFLKDVKVSSSFRNHIVADDFKTLLESFPTLSLEEEEEISHFKERHIKFWLEWQL